jgi:geranylgeranyl diphosphate synthase, type II
MPSGEESELEQFLASWRKEVEATLGGQLPPDQTRPAVIHEAMRYSTMAGGKRIRPLLAVAAAAAVGADAGPLLKAFCALELIHTYSLVHDDLPALDNDDLRRGRPTSHVVYGEAFAILAGDALLTEAFAWLSEPIVGIAAERQLRAVNLVARAVDSKGMIGGQVADLESERLHDGTRSPAALGETLEFIHRNKTGRLLTASVMLGGLLGGATEGQLRALESYGDSVGLAFQIVDDLLDVEETAETLGKTAGKDAEQGKLTYPAVWGAERARQEVDSLLSAALVSADIIGGPRNYLGGIARYLCARRS